MQRDIEFFRSSWNKHTISGRIGRPEYRYRQGIRRVGIELPRPDERFFYNPSSIPELRAGPGRTIPSPGRDMRYVNWYDHGIVSLDGVPNSMKLDLIRNVKPLGRDRDPHGHNVFMKAIDIANKYA